MDNLIHKLINSINTHGLQYTAEKLLDERYDHYRRAGLQMEDKKKKLLMHRQKLGFQMYSALLSPCEGERTPELAVENLMRFIRKRKYLKDSIKDLF